MSLPGPLRAELLRYRKRKQLALDGGVGGLAPAAHPPAGSKDPSLALDLPHLHHDYDPVHAAYQQMSAEYEPPAAWFEGLHPRQTPALRLVRRAGRYTAIVKDVLNFPLGELRSIIIKVQHHCTSDRKGYGKLEDVPIRHEYCLVFKKPIGAIPGVEQAPPQAERCLTPGTEART